MNANHWMLALILLAGASGLVAQDEPVSDIERIEARFKDIGAVIDSVLVTKETLDAHTKHAAGFETTMRDDAEFAALMNESWAKAFGHAAQSDAFKKWMTKHGVNDDWLRRYFRVSTLRARQGALDSIGVARTKIKTSRRSIQSARNMLPTGQYKEAIDDLDKNERMLDDLETIAKALPEGSAAEQQVLVKRDDQPADDADE